MISVIVFLLGVLLTAIVLHKDVEADYQKWLKGIEVIHKKEFIERVAYLVLPYACFVIVQMGQMFEHHHPPAMVITVSLLNPAFAMGIVYMTLFDGWYNRRRHFGWWYNGSPKGKKDDSAFDKVWRRVSDRAERWLKIGLSVVLVSLYIFYCFHKP